VPSFCSPPVHLAPSERPEDFCACSYACLLGDVDELPLAHRGIADEQVAESAPLVRALVVERLEKIWRTCEPWITGTAGKPDPRFVEAGIRVCDRLTRLYRLDDPVPGSEQPDGELIPKAELVLAGLRELEARMNDGTLA
jgi:hypothetical protein